MNRVNDLYILKDYYRTEINLDTAKDVSHLVSLLKSVCPKLSLCYGDKVCYLLNVRNHMHQKIKITWLYQI